MIERGCVSLMKDPFPKSVSFHPSSSHSIFHFLFQAIKIFNSADFFFLSGKFIKHIKMTVQTIASV